MVVLDASTSDVWPREMLRMIDARGVIRIGHFLCLTIAVEEGVVAEDGKCLARHDRQHAGRLAIRVA